MAAYSFDVNLKDRLISALRSEIYNTPGLTGTILAPLTTAAGLSAAYSALSRHAGVSDLEIIRGKQDIDRAASVGTASDSTAILTDAIVAAGNTPALLIAALDAQHSTPTVLLTNPASQHFYA